MHTLAQSLMKELQQEIAIEGVEVVLTPFLLYTPQPAGAVVGIAIELTWCPCVQEALAQDEVDKQEAVEHERGVPFSVSLCLNPADEAQECGVFALEAVIELLG